MNSAGHGGAARGVRSVPARLGFFGLLGLFAGVGAAYAQSAAVGQTNLTLDAALDLAARHNPDLKNLRARWEAMSERAAQSAALPNPMLTYSGMEPAGGGTRSGITENRVMIEQEFPGPRKRALRGEIAGWDAETARRELDGMARDVELAVKENYHDLLAVRRATDIVRAETGVINQIAGIAETMYSTGERPQQDVLKARAETTMLKQRLLDLSAQEDALQSRLNTLLGRRPDTPLATVAAPLPHDFHVSIDDLLGLAATNRPDVRAAQAQVERSALQKELMKREATPDYRLGMEYRSVRDGEDMIMVTAGVDLPVWRSKYSAGVREADKMKQAGEAALEAAERNGALEVQTAVFTLKTALRTLDLYRTELVPQAEARFKASEAGYRTGKVDFMDLLESQRFLIEARLMTAMAEGKAGAQFARLERAVGAELKVSAPAGGIVK